MPATVLADLVTSAGFRDELGSTDRALTAAAGGTLPDVAGLPELELFAALRRRLKAAEPGCPPWAVVATGVCALAAIGLYKQR